MQSQSVCEQFIPLELIGRGSFGCVRKVQRKSDGKLFVRKEVSYDSMNMKERSQLIAEFRILRNLQSENIVQYLHHDHIQDRHLVHLYMEFCQGGDLSAVIKRCKNMNVNNKLSGEGRLCHVPEDIIWSILTQMLLALYRCHYGVDAPKVENWQADRNDLLAKIDLLSLERTPKSVDTRNIVMHRDIKPENIFLSTETALSQINGEKRDDENHVVKLGDFGLAKSLNPETEFAKTYVGTPYYMSPEVLVDRPYTAQCDIWSLGCVIYELCALRPPFIAKTHLQLQQKIQIGDYPPLPPNYSHKLCQILKLCIVTNPEKRATTHQLLQDPMVKISRKSLELKSQENRVFAKEREVKFKESQVERIISQKLQSQWEDIEKDLEEIRKSYQNEFDFVVERQVEARLSRILSRQRPSAQAASPKVKGPRELQGFERPPLEMISDFQSVKLFTDQKFQKRYGNNM